MLISDIIELLVGEDTLNLAQALFIANPEFAKDLLSSLEVVEKDNYYASKD